MSDRDALEREVAELLAVLAEEPVTGLREGSGMDGALVLDRPYHAPRTREDAPFGLAP